MRGVACVIKCHSDLLLTEFGALEQFLGLSSGLGFYYQGSVCGSFDLEQTSSTDSFELFCRPEDIDFTERNVLVGRFDRQKGARRFHERLRSRVPCLVSERARVSVPGVARGRAEVIAGGGGARRARVRAGEGRGAAVIHGVIRSRSREEARVGVGVR